MAEKEQTQVEQQDPIVAGTGAVNETISVEEPQEEVVEQEMTEEIDWESEAKKFQSMYDRRTVEMERLDSETQQLQQLKGLLEQRPELVDTIEKQLAGESTGSSETLDSTEAFDPWDAYHKPDSPSYKYRVANEKRLVHDTVDKELAKLKGQMAMNNLKNELVSEYSLDTNQADEFLNFATTPKANLPIETLIKVWREQNGVAGKPNENKKAVEKAKSIPKPAGVLQGGEIPQKPEQDQMWDRIMNAGSSGKLTK